MAPSSKPIIEHFQFCPSCGASIGGSAPQATPFHCESCDFELHFSPVTSAAAIISRTDGKILFIRRKKEPRKGSLGVPGGFVNPGESLEDALHREVKEEVNLTLENSTFLGGWPNQYPFKNVIYPVTDTYFSAQVNDLSQLALCDDEVDAVLWIHPAELNLEEIAFNSLREAIKARLSV